MRILEKVVSSAVILYLFLFTAPSTAHIVSLKFQSNSRQIIPISDFDYTNAGYVSFVISSSSPPADPSRIGFFLESRQHGFFLLTREARNQDILEFQKSTTSICPLDFTSNSSSVVVLFTFQNLSSHDHHADQFSFNKSFPVTNSGMKSLMFVNCNNESHSLLTVEGRAELYNIDGTTKNFLSDGLTQLPFLSFIFFFVYVSFLGFWILVCFKNRRVFNRTQLLMGGLLLLNCVYFICVVADLHYVKVTGTAHGLDVVFSIVHGIRAVLLSTVIVLIGAGWLFWNPFLYREERLVLMIAIVLQVWANVDPILPWEAAVPYNKQNSSIADIFNCFLIIIPILLSHCSLHEFSDTDLNAHRNVEKLWLFMGLYIVYMTVTRISILALATRLEIYAVKETAIVVFCVLMFYMFRPVDRTRIKHVVETGLSTFNSISCFFYSPV